MSISSENSIDVENDLETITLEDSDSNKGFAESTTRQTRTTRADRTLCYLRDTQKMAQKFIGNFDPEKSTREKRKLKKKLSVASKRYANAKYDEKGIHIQSKKDLCDCLVETCRGCFFPCPACRSTKCGGECRRFRKFVYETLEYEGEQYKLKNLHAPVKP